jgi:hypothetical protein
MTINHPLPLLWFAVLATGCAHQAALIAEHTLDAGVTAWSEHVDDAIANCRAQNLPTETARAACIEPVAQLDRDVVAPAVLSAVLALRAYWLGVSLDESPAELAKHLDAFRSALAGLPFEYFGGQP